MKLNKNKVLLVGRKLILGIILPVILASCNNSNKELPEELKWTQGGTLHKSMVTDWKMATDENKLATCADFVCNIKSSKGETYTSNIEMKSDAIYLKSCIDEAIKGDTSADNNKVSEVAALCLILKESK